jgi:hypothetical protein
METPYLKIVEPVRQTRNYDAQQAVKALFNKPMAFSVRIYVCFHARDNRLRRLIFARSLAGHEGQTGSVRQGDRPKIR